MNYFNIDLRVLLIITGLVGGEHAPGKASGTKKTKHGQLHPLSRVKELTNYTREWLSDNLVCFIARGDSMFSAFGMDFWPKTWDPPLYSPKFYLNFGRNSIKIF